MPHPEEIDAPLDSALCAECIAEDYLSDEVRRDGTPAMCSYCETRGQTTSLEDLASRLETAFAEHYIRTSRFPEWWQERLQADKESDYEWNRSGTPVLDLIEMTACIPRDAAQDVLDILSNRHALWGKDSIGEEAEFDGESYYEELPMSSDSWREAWNEFERALKCQTRFFSHSAAQHLTEVFGGIDKLKTSRGRSLVVVAGPRGRVKKLFRARVFQSDAELQEALCRPDLKLGSPPARFASDGRMNARGISVFYGATTANTAIAEVRPPVGSRVAVAEFSITRPLRLLDLTALEGVVDRGSVFDPTLKRRHERVAFLRTLGQHMTRAVMPDDAALDYLATQAVADFLATGVEPELDGIIFPSVQAKQGRNVVLFQKASRVAQLALPSGTKISATTSYETGDGEEPDFWVREVVPKPTGAPARVGTLDNDAFEFLPSLAAEAHLEDDREPALVVDPNTVHVHIIEWVSFRSSAHPVHRWREDDREPEF